MDAMAYANRTDRRAGVHSLRNSRHDATPYQPQKTRRRTHKHGGARATPHRRQLSSSSWQVKLARRHVTRVKKTGRNRSGNRGYRSNRPGPVPVPAGFKPAQIQILNLNFKTWKNPKKFLKILQVATNLMVSNFFKYSFI